MQSQWYASIRSHCSWILIILVCYAPNVARSQLAVADEPAATQSIDEEVESLIEQLSSPSFSNRETASKRLLEIGAPALELVRQAKQLQSIEVQERANRICEEIDKGIFENVTKKFILSADQSQSFGLPAWDLFRSITGSSRTSKLLFVTMLRTQGDLAKHIESVIQSKGTENSVAAYEELGAKAETEAERLHLRISRGELPTAGDTVGLLLACALFNDTAAIGSASNEVNEVIVSSLYRTGQGDSSKPSYERCMRALAGQWIPKTPSSFASDVLSIAHQRGIPEGATIARRHLDASNDRETRVFALQCLARFGNAGDIASVSKLLDDELIVYEFNDQSNIGFLRDGIHEDNMPPPGSNGTLPTRNDRKLIVRINDLALAVCLQLGSEDVGAAFPKYQPNESNSLFLVDFAFPADDQTNHKLAIARWKQEHPQYAPGNN